MTTRGYPLQKEIHEGIITLLINAAFPEGTGQPYAVITTAPGQWLPYCSSDAVTILDVSAMTNARLWLNETDLQDRVLEMIRRAGWSDEYIAINYKTKGSPTFIPDIVLLGNQGDPLAIVEIKLPTYPLGEALNQAQRYSQALSAPFFFATNGHHFLSADSKAPLTMNDFPSPQELGLTLARPQHPKASLERPGISIVRCDDSSALKEALKQCPVNALIVDYTLPWGDVKSAAVAQVCQSLPDLRRFSRYLDSSTAITLLAAWNASFKRLVTILPDVVVTHPNRGAIRECLRSHLKLAGVINLPEGLFSPVIGVSSALIALGEYASVSSKKVVFIGTWSRGDIIHPGNQPWFGDFKAGLQGQPMKWAPLKSVEPNQAWDVAEILLKAILEPPLHRIAETVPLGELCELFLGFAHSREEATPGRGIYVIRGRDLSSASLNKDDLTCVKADRKIPGRTRVAEGDILLQRIGTNPKCMIVGPGLEGAIASDTVLVLRPRDPRANPVMISQFLRSNTGQQILKMHIRGQYAPTISVSALRTIPIPLVPERISRDLDELQRIEQDLRLRAERIESMRLGLFSAESPQDLEGRLDQIRQVARVVAASIQEAETSAFRIRNLYPFPLAYPFRTLAGITSPQELYMEQLRVAENILAFLGSLGLAVATPENLRPSGLVLEKLWQGGISAGKWRQVSQECAKILDRYKQDRLASSLAALWIGKRQTRFSLCIEELVVARNEVVHHKGPKINEEFRDGALRVGKLLGEAMDSLSFLTEYPIRLVTDMDIVRGTLSVVAQTLRYVGDHPGLPQEVIEYRKPIKKNDLYIESRTDEWLPLFPFITVQICPTCKTRETYFIDRWNGPGKKAALRSFERGHTEEVADIGTALSAL